MREEVLEFFEDQEPARKPRVHEVCADRVDMNLPPRGQGKGGREEYGFRAELTDLKKDVAQLTKSVQALVQAQSGQAQASGTQTRGGREDLQCYNCLKRGHTKPFCTEDMVCFHCKGTGHSSKECPKKEREGNTSSTPTNQPTSPSPEAKRGSVITDKAATETELVDRLVAKSPQCTILIGGMEVGCIVDTGAEASIIPASLYHRELKAKLGELQATTGLFLNVVGVGGIEIPIEGYVEVPIVVKGKQMIGSFLVVADQACAVQDSRCPILIGCNILRHLEDANIHWGIQKQDEGGMKEATINRISPIKIHPVSSEIPPPLSVRRTICDWNTEEHAPLPNCDVVVHPTSTQQELDVTAYEGLHYLKSSASFDLLLANETNEEVHITPKTTVAEASLGARKSEVLLEVQSDNIMVSICEVVQEDKDSQVPESESEAKIIMEEPERPPGVQLEDLTPEGEKRVKKLLQEHEAVLSKGPFDVGRCDVIPHEIQLDEGPPIRPPYRRIHPSVIPQVILQPVWRRWGRLFPCASQEHRSGLAVRSRKHRVIDTDILRDRKKVTSVESWLIPRGSNCVLRDRARVGKQAGKVPTFNATCNSFPGT